MQATSREEAIKTALESETPLPVEGDYVSDTISLDEGSSVVEYDVSDMEG